MINILFIILSLLLSLAIDLIFCELPSKIHPVVIIGKMITFFKNIFIKINSRISGLLTLICVTIVSSVILYLIYYINLFNNYLFFAMFTIILTSTFSVKLLLKTASDVKDDLDVSIDQARQSVSYLVSRNTDELTESFIVSAVIESMTENITDSYVAVIFYYTIISIIVLILNIENGLFYIIFAAVFYRIANTLDAMLGYKTDELEKIGFVPAKLDDILNYIPARLSGVLIVISAYFLKYDYKNAYKIMLRDARNCPSPNSGYTMAPTAGALNIKLIKKNTYTLGDENKQITKDDISKAVSISKLTIFLFTLIVLFVFIMVII